MKKPNRPLNKWEQEDERQTAIAFKRPQKHFIYDPPFYPYFPPEALVNFHLKYNFDD